MLDHAEEGEEDEDADLNDEDPCLGVGHRLASRLACVRLSLLVSQTMQAMNPKAISMSGSGMR